MPKFSANLSMMFTEAPFLDRFEAAAAAGFRAVEFLSPYEYDAAALASRLRSNDLTQVLFNLPAGKWAEGERGIAIFSSRTPEFRAGVGLAIEYAEAMNCKMLHCLAGIAPLGVDPDVLLDVYCENLRFAADALHLAGMSLLIEPINTFDIPGYFLSGTSQARGIIATVNAPNLFLQYDAYHMHIMEGDLANTITKNIDAIRHVQIADAPGRHELGTADIDFFALFNHLDSIGYDGWVGCEYRPKSTTVASLAWLRAHFD